MVSILFTKNFSSLNVEHAFYEINAKMILSDKNICVWFTVYPGRLFGFYFF